MDLEKPFDSTENLEEEVLGNLDENILRSVYERVVNEENPTEAVRLNENFVSTIKILAEGSKDKNFNLFVLSLNTPDLMKLWYKKFLPQAQAELTKIGVTIKITALMGNQIRWQRTEGQIKRVAGVIKHVTSHNKWQYIPIGTIMLADDRETTTRAQDFVNVLNIEGKNFSPQLVEYVSTFSKISQDLKTLGLDLYELPEEIRTIYDNLTIVLKNMIILKERLNLPATKNQLSFYEELFDKNIVLLRTYTDGRQKKGVAADDGK